jgi:hypothetical protein
MGMIGKRFALVASFLGAQLLVAGCAWESGDGSPIDYDPQAQQQHLAKSGAAAGTTAGVGTPNGSAQAATDPGDTSGQQPIQAGVAAPAPTVCNAEFQRCDPEPSPWQTPNGPTGANILIQ